MPAPPHSHGPGCGCAEFASPLHAEASVLPFVDLARLRALNERAAGSARRVFKGQSDGERRDRTHVLESAEGDADLLLHVPFTCPVKITRLCVGGDRLPARCRLFTGREDLDFAAAEASAPLQELALVEDPGADVWHALKVAKFANVSSLQILLTGTLAAAEDDVLISFIGLRGLGSGHASALPASSVYESAPRPQDHAGAAGEAAARFAQR